MSDTLPSLTMDSIAKRIFEIRGQRVMLDEDLAVLYGVETRYIPRAVNRNPNRFPSDFAFQLSLGEWTSLRSTFGISKIGRGGRRSMPYVFTEHGALMLSSVLNSPRADEVSLLIVRAFVWMRQMLPAHEELAIKVSELEQAVGKHDKEINLIIESLRQLMLPPSKEKRRIGF